MGDTLTERGASNYNSSLTARCTYTFTGAAGNGLAASYCAFLELPANQIIIVRALCIYCTTTLTVAAGALFNFGTVNNSTLFIANTAADDLNQYALWASATVVTTGGVAIPAGHKDVIIHGQSGGMSIGGTPTVNDITAGVLVADVVYDAVTAGAVLTSVTGS
jgi:hypothetical protein